MNEESTSNEEEKKQRVAIFIDGNNFYHSLKRILRDNEKVSYERLMAALSAGRILKDVFYYVPTLDLEADIKKYGQHRRFIKDLRTLRIKVTLCNFKKIKQLNGRFLYFTKGDDIKLAHDLLIGAFDNLYDVAIIVSGDEDFLPLIQTLRNRFKKKIGNAYFRSSSSYKLRKACNFSINLHKLLPKFIIQN